MHMNKLMSAVMGLALVAGGTARAAGIAVDLQSARGVGMASSLIGASDDAASIYFNPAGIAQGQGLEAMLGGVPIFPHFDATVPGPRDISGPSYVIPPIHAYATYGISDEWTVGIGLFTPFGLKVEWDPAWDPVGRTIVTRADLKVFDLQPTVAYKYGPLRIGLGVQIVRSTVELKKDIGPLNGQFVGADLGAGAWGWGGNVGVQYEVVPKVLQLGAQYRSQVKLDFDGNAHFSNVPPSFASTFVDQAAKTSLKLPDNFGFGVAYRPIPELLLDFDVNYFAWQYFQAIDIKFQTTPSLNTYEAKQWHHSWNYRIGGEYTFNENLQLRAGVLYDKTPSPDYTLLPDVPDADRVNICLGGTYRWGAFRVDLGYQFIKFFHANSTHPLFPASYSASAHVLALTLGFKI
jgi:long-chain fatty acid transport protein